MKRDERVLGRWNSVITAMGSSGSGDATARLLSASCQERTGSGLVGGHFCEVGGVDVAAGNNGDGSRGLETESECARRGNGAARLRQKLRFGCDPAHGVADLV